MASSSRYSSGSTQLQNSCSEEELQLLMDQRKRKRKESNRESAKRSRVRKQKHMDDLMARVAQLRRENHQILTGINLTTQNYINVETENSVLSAQIIELSERLQSLNDILSYMNNNSSSSNGLFETESVGPESFMNNNPWNFMFFNQSIMANADIFQH